MSLKVDGLTVYYKSLRGDVKAVDGATFEIADGEIMGLAGESGCGKTTLGKSLIRMDARMRYVDGRVELDGRELPVWDNAKMNAFRFKDVSIIPQYALSALNPTRKIGPMASDLLASRGVEVHKVLPEFKRRLKIVGLSEDVLERFPIELSGGMKQRVVMVLSSAPRSVAPHRRRGDVRARRVDAASGVRAARRVPRPRLREEHDRDHARPLRPVPDRRHDPRHVRGEARGEGTLGDDDRRSEAPLHAAPALVASGGRRSIRGAAIAGHPGTPAVPSRPSLGLSVS